jgi:hypothetical protein
MHGYRLGRRAVLRCHVRHEGRLGLRLRLNLSSRNAGAFEVRGDLLLNQSAERRRNGRAGRRLGDTLRPRFRCAAIDG